MDFLKKGAAICADTPTLVSIGVAGALALWQLWAGQISLGVQAVVFSIFIFLTGIPHGALDHLIAAESAKRDNKRFQMPLFLVTYLGTMLFYGVLWYALPGGSLLFFILISAWHFGETDLEKAPYTTFWNLARFAFGAFVLLYLLLLHADETGPIVQRITRAHPAVMEVWNYLVQHKGFVLGINGLGFVLLFSIAYWFHPLVLNLQRYARLFILLGLLAFLPLLPAFALYFGGWHALSSFESIRHYLMPVQDQGVARYRAGLRIWSKTLLFTVLALVFLGASLLYWLYFLQSFDPLPLLFIFLSLITLPHLNVMWGMHRRSVSGR